MCPRLALVATAMKIWDSTSYSEIIVQSTAKGLNRHSVQHNIAYLVISEGKR